MLQVAAKSFDSSRQRLRLNLLDM